MIPSPVRLGLHLPISGGIEKAAQRARELGCSAVQIFSRNPRGWRASPLAAEAVSAFRRETERGGIEPVVVHTLYLLNLASEDETLYRRSIGALAEDLDRAAALGARFVVAHMGSVKEGCRGAGRRRLVKALRSVLDRKSPVMLLLENSAGGGGALGASLEEIAEIIGGEAEDRLGFCFDTCHGFAAGYDFRSRGQSEALREKIRATVGLGRLKLLHLNDSSAPLGSRLDRHEHIGKGQIGVKGFRSLLGRRFFRGLPLILETPRKGPEEDVKNLARIRAILFPSRGELARRAGSF